jgi:hypothetical protein
LRSDAAQAPSGSVESPAAESESHLAGDSPSHADTFRELFGVDPPADDTPCDGPSAVAAFDFDFLTDSGLQSAADVANEPDTLSSVVITPAGEAAPADAAAEVVEPQTTESQTTPSADDAQVLGVSLVAAEGMQPLDGQPSETEPLTAQIVEPAQPVEGADTAIAPAQVTVTEADPSLPLPAVSPTAAAAEGAAVAGVEGVGTVPVTITPQRSFFQFAAAVSDPVASDAAGAVGMVSGAETLVAMGEPQASVPVDAAPVATTADDPVVEVEQYVFTSDTETEDQEEAIAIDGVGFAAIDSERSSNEATSGPFPRERLSLRRKEKPGHPVRNFVGMVLGAFFGMFLAYSLLCLIFGAEIDFLHVYHKPPEGTMSRDSGDAWATRPVARQKSAFEVIEDQREAGNANKK